MIDTDGEDDSGDGVSHARVPDWAWSALGGQSGDEDYIIINYYPHYYPQSGDEDYIIINYYLHYYPQSGDEDDIIINYYPHRDDQDLNDSNHFGDQNVEDVGEHSFLW